MLFGRVYALLNAITPRVNEVTWGYYYPVVLLLIWTLLHNGKTYKNILSLLKIVKFLKFI